VVKMSHPHMAVLGRTTEDGAEPDTGNRMAAGSWRDTTRVKQAVPPANGTVLRVDGAINFASSAAILAKVTALVEEEAGAEGPQFFVLHMANVEHIDLSGLHMLHSAQSTLERQGVTLLVSQATFAVRYQLAKMADLGHAAPRLFSTIDDAVAGWGDHAAFPVLEP
jgi:MFS superfamily sulfate permease-like transporter